MQLVVQPLFTISSSGSQATPEFRDPFTGRVVIPGQPGSTSIEHVDAGVGFGYQFFLGAQESKVKPYIGMNLDIQSFKSKDNGSMADNMSLPGPRRPQELLLRAGGAQLRRSLRAQLKNRRTRPDRFTVGITYLF